MSCPPVDTVGPAEGAIASGTPRGSPGVIISLLNHKTKKEKEKVKKRKTWNIAELPSLIGDSLSDTWQPVLLSYIVPISIDLSIILFLASATSVLTVSPLTHQLFYLPISRLPTNLSSPSNPLRIDGPRKGRMLSLCASISSTVLVVLWTSPLLSPSP